MGSKILTEGNLTFLNNVIDAEGEQWLNNTLATPEGTQYNPNAEYASTSKQLEALINTLVNSIEAKGEAATASDMGRIVELQMVLNNIESIEAETATLTNETGNDILSESELQEHINTATEENAEDRSTTDADLISELANLYAELVNSNQKWSWMDDFPNANELTKTDKAQIKALAVEKGLIPNVSIKIYIDNIGIKYRYADFESAGLVKKRVYLPKHLWGESDSMQFRWLDEQIGGRPIGFTWHHFEIAGYMDLVPTGIHNIYNHNGGRSKNHWAYRKEGR